jgi:NADH dehydrogenase
MRRKARVVVLGAGFGGLEFCKAFRHPDAEITVVDRTNHHLFQPLLYQVATAGLSAPEIAQPIRSILSGRSDVRVLLSEVEDIDLEGRKVVLPKQTLEYDYLVLALGGRTGYFGRPEWEPFAPGLKTLEDALSIRSRVLLSFEKAEMESDAEERARLMTVAVVGGGPTGVELAGAFAELGRHVLRADFRRIDPTQARVVLIEAGPRLLAHLSTALSASAREQLERIGVQVRVDAKVRDIAAGRVELDSGETIRAENIIWAAGVLATPLTAKLNQELDRMGRVKVMPDLSLSGHPEAFAIGDMASVAGADGRPVPGISPAAIQMADHAAKVVAGDLDSSGRGPRPAFRYRDKGTMATIGRSAAVAQIGSIEFSGFAAWLAWLGIHLLFLVGFRNKVSVFIQWAYSYITYKRGSRIITRISRDEARAPLDKQVIK